LCNDNLLFELSKLSLANLSLV